MGVPTDFSKPIPFKELQNPESIAELPPDYYHINKGIKIDAKLLNFGQFFSGRALGSNIIIKNCNSTARSLRISVSNFKDFTFEQITNHIDDIPKKVL